MTRRTHEGALLWAIVGLWLAAVLLLFSLSRVHLTAWEHDAEMLHWLAVARRELTSGARARPPRTAAEPLASALDALDSVASAADRAAFEEDDAEDTVFRDRAVALRDRLREASASDAPRRRDATELEALADETGELEALVSAHGERHRRQARRQLDMALTASAAALVLVVVLLVGSRRRSRRLEAAETEQRRRLELTQRMDAVGRLAGGIAHDINNHLAGIHSQCELVLRKDLDRSKLEGRMQTVLETVLRASSLIERLLAFAGRQEHRPEVVQLNEIVEPLAHVLDSSLPDGVRLHLDLAPDLPMAELDAARIEQVVANLVVNASDALPDGGSIRVATRKRSESGSEIELSVTDDGVGIPDDRLEHIFEPFYTTKSGRGNSGLGLATVYGVVDEAGGTVAVESTLGEGTVFRVRFPATTAARRPSPATASSTTTAAESERILLVDDNEGLADATRAHLESLGYAVTTAASVAEAVEAEGPFDLVITDVQLPDGSGSDLMARLRRDAPVPVLYMSGYTDRIALRSGRAKREAFFVKKPFSADGLARMARALLDQSTGDGTSPSR